MPGPPDAAVTAAVAAVTLAVVARTIVLVVVAGARAVRRALGRLLSGSAAAFEASAARGAVLGLLGAGSALLAPSTSAAAAPVAVAGTEAAASPRAPHPTERLDRGEPGDGGDRADRAAARGGEPTVVVRPGDCLWDIARRHLPPGATHAQVADAWPRWWAANRAVIGPDPDLIHPGTRLVVPPRFRSTGTSTTAAPAASSFDPDRR